MKTIYITLILFLSLSLTISAQQKKQLTILHTNDTHSCIYPISPNVADTVAANRGGYLRRLNMIKQERKKDNKVLLLDSGDFSQGSPYYTLFKGDVEVKLMNMMGYDACALGNHEFDYGIENMARLFRLCEFPILCANYGFNSTPLEGLVKPYVVIKRNGVKIGIFGLSPKLEGLIAIENSKGITFFDPIEKAKEVTNILKNKEKCDVVICLSHLGWDMGPAYDDEKLVKATKDIDLVLGGHSHTFLKKIEYITNLDGKETACCQDGKQGLIVGKIILDLKKKASTK